MGDIKVQEPFNENSSEWRDWLRSSIKELVVSMGNRGWTNYYFDAHTQCHWFNADPYAIEVFEGGPYTGRFYVQNFRKAFAQIVLSGKINDMIALLDEKQITVLPDYQI